MIQIKDLRHHDGGEPDRAPSRNVLKNYRVGNEGSSRGVRGQRDRRGRSLEFMMRLESRLRLSEERREDNGSGKLE